MSVKAQPIVGQTRRKRRDLDVIYDYEKSQERAVQLQAKCAFSCYPLHHDVGREPIEVYQLERYQRECYLQAEILVPLPESYQFLQCI